jgi:crotonobetainyl-CoA:carnitine CoA-transferase CaiB-like acyl-CoA transferase
LKTLADPVTVAETIYELLEQATQSQPTSHWLEAFEAADVPAAPVLDIDAHLADPQVVHNGTYVEVDHPTVGRIRVPRHPARVTS